jgi:Flp pilus assembly protein TadD
MKQFRFGSALLLAAVLVCSAAPQKKAAKEPEKDPQYQYEKGMIALNYGLPQEAIRYGNLAVSLDPKHYGGHSLLGHANYQLGNFAEAVAEYGKAAELRPDLAEAHYNLAMACLQSGDQDRAAAEFEKAEAIKADPKAEYYLAKVHFGQKKLDLALEEIQKSLKLNPRSAGSYSLKGVILNELGRYLEAVGSFEAGLVLAPNDTGLQINLGIAYVNGNQPDKARAAFEKVLPQIKSPELKAKVEGFLKSIKAP